MTARQPVWLDLCCGRGTASQAAAAVGYQCVGYDIDDCGYPYYLVQQDIREVESIGDYWRGLVDVMWCSPPCTEFARFRMPWLRKRGLPAPDLSIVDACFLLRDLIQPRIFILENVQGLQRFLGKADVCREPYYFWGVAMMPYVGAHRKKESYSSRERLQRASLPPDLARGFAEMCWASYTG